MDAIKLVVVSPFNNYRRGSEIRDEIIVGNILDKQHPMNRYAHNCRRVVLNLIEKSQYIPPSQPDAPAEVDEKPAVSIPDVEPAPLPPQDPASVEADLELKQDDMPEDDESLHLSSVKDDERPAKNPRRKR